MAPLASARPDLVQFWDLELNDRDPATVGASSSHVAHWRCVNRPEHAWKASVFKMVRRETVCPACASLAFRHPDLALEWDAERNGELTPEDVPAGSAKEVHWICSQDSRHRWRARVSSRTSRGSGCPVCRGRLVVAGLNDLATTHPVLASQWDVPANAPLAPSEVAAGSATSVAWICPEDDSHRWQARVQHRAIDGSGCARCAQRAEAERRKRAGTPRKRPSIDPAKSLAATHPRLVEEWADEDLAPTDATRGSGLTVLWRCGEAGHGTWRAKVSERAAGRARCPVCRGRRVIPGLNDLATTHPHLGRQWAEPSTSPSAVTWRCRDKVLWRCATEPLHEWRATVRSRAEQGNGCPLCRGLVARPGVNDLATTHPHLVAEWDQHDLDPARVRPGSNRRVRWRCASDPGHPGWETAVSERALRGTGCPRCAYAPTAGVDDLATTHPHLVDEWADDTLSPQEVRAGSGRMVRWRCGTDAQHVWRATPYSRANGSGCPACIGRLTIPGVNDLATTHPLLASEWADGDREAGSLTAVSTYRAQWRCGTNPEHIWTCVVRQRAIDGSGCPVCWRYSFASSAEGEVEAIVRKLVPTDEVVRHARTIAPSTEFDVAVPARGVAIEFNGLYWHSEAAGRGLRYHAEKSQAARAAGLHLIHVWEDDWAERRDVVVRAIAHRLVASDRLGEPGVLRDADPSIWQRLSARDLAVRALEQGVASTFLDANHIQGRARASLHLALVDEGGTPRAVLSVMRGRAGAWTIERYATRGTVRGGFTRLLAHAERRIIDSGGFVGRWVTFADESISTAGLYERNGFTRTRDIPPDYRYAVRGHRVHKFNYRLKRFRADPALDYIEGATERDLADLNGLVRIWDCGKSRWERSVPTE